MHRQDPTLAINELKGCHKHDKPPKTNSTAKQQQQQNQQTKQNKKQTKQKTKTKKKQKQKQKQKQNKKKTKRNKNNKCTKQGENKIGRNLKEVGLDSRFEWLQGNGIDDDHGNEVSE